MSADVTHSQADELDAEPIPISAVQHAVYCLRQAALIHLERLWEENRLTAEGRVLHLATDDPGGRKVRGVRRVTALPVASRTLGIAGVVDLVEFHRGEQEEMPFPIEIKRGKPKLHRADEAQLCAQALCLEEMTGQAVPNGALFYAETKRRTNVSFDDQLRALTIDAIDGLRRVLTSRATPSALYESRKCRACSLIDLCRPKANQRCASVWRAEALDQALMPSPS